MIVDERYCRDWWRDRDDLLLVSTLGGAPPMASRKALWVGLIGAGIVGTTAAGLMPILDASLLAVLALRGLSPREARVRRLREHRGFVCRSTGYGAHDGGHHQQRRRRAHVSDRVFGR